MTAARWLSRVGRRVNPVGAVGGVLSPVCCPIVTVSNTAFVSARMPSTTSAVGETVTFEFP